MNTIIIITIVCLTLLLLIGLIALVSNPKQKAQLMGGFKVVPTSATRVEVITKNGREFVYRNDTSIVTLHYQDNGKTLKVFIDNPR